MNIFILDNDIEKCAQAHVDKHMKMILEAAQLLCTAVNFYAGKQATPYKSSHANHPCALWVRESSENFYYLTRLMYSLNNEYKHRYNKNCNHKSIDVIYDNDVYELAQAYYPLTSHDIGLTPFALCMPDEYKVEGSAVQSYRNYYNGDKQHLFKWTNRNKPFWITGKHK